MKPQEKKLLESYYYSCIWADGMRLFSELTDSEKALIRCQWGFASYKAWKTFRALSKTKMNRP